MGLPDHRSDPRSWHCVVRRDGSCVSIRSGLATIEDYRDHIAAREWRRAVLASTDAVLQQHVVSSEDAFTDFAAEDETRERSGSRNMGCDHLRVAGYRVFLGA